MTSVSPWFFLKSVPGIGNHLFKRLIDQFKTPENVLNASPKDFSEIHGISGKVVSNIFKHKMPDSVQRDLEESFKKGFTIVTMNHPEYPELLKEIPDPPPYLYVAGTLSSTPRNIAVVGSRNATSYGITAAKKISGDLALLGIHVASGMARGIDTAAHTGTLSQNGITVAVLGSGLGRIYPPENEGLFRDIAEKGAVISEFPVMAGPTPHNFPLRNRIICGMSLGTVVVEASTKSGSLITARLAAEQGREVFAVPGSIQSFRSAGTHKLIKQGAKLIENAQDIVEELPYILTMSPSGETVASSDDADDTKRVLSSLSEDAKKVLSQLEPYPVHIDILKRKLPFSTGELLSILLQLELSGLIIQTPGKYFHIKEEHCGKTINHR